MVQSGNRYHVAAWGETKHVSSLAWRRRWRGRVLCGAALLARQLCRRGIGDGFLCLLLGQLPRRLFLREGHWLLRWDAHEEWDDDVAVVSGYLCPPLPSLAGARDASGFPPVQCHRYEGRKAEGLTGAQHAPVLRQTIFSLIEP
ncbi:hypothetical protein B0H12DRAFT_1238830 [Mycena haematopus]|nr:hypothetical protein B0H12DRAFT_1238830 [Mycena haematopus]